MELKETFSERLYIEIQRHKRSLEKISKTICKTSSSLDIPIMVVKKFTILNKMAEAHDALVCIGNKQFLDDKNRFKYKRTFFEKMMS